MARWLRGAPLALALLGWLVAAAPVSAHAELLSSDPRPNETLAASPDAIVLRFTEPIDPGNLSVSLLEQDERPVPGVAQPQTLAGGQEVRLPVSPLDPGVYLVRFRAVSAGDGHVITGLFAFQIDPAGTAPPLAFTPVSEAPNSDARTAITRWIALASALALFGMAAFWRFSGRPAVVERGLDPHRLGVWRALASAAFATWAGLAFFLTFASIGVGESETGAPHQHFVLDFAGAFGWTPFGIAMRVAQGASFGAFLLASAWFTAREEARARRGARPDADERQERIALLLVLALGAAALGGFAFAGHPAAVGGALFALIDWGHLLAAAVWIGTLPGFLLFYVLYARRLPPDARGALVLSALRRHSRLAMVAAPIVALTGVGNSAAVLGSARDIIGSDYGNLVLGKAILFSVAAALGSANFFLIRGLRAARLPTLIAAEAGIGLVAVLAAATLATLNPPVSRSVAVVAAPPTAVHLIAEQDGTVIHAVVSAAAPGAQLYQAAVVDAATQRYRSDVEELALVFQSPGGAPPERVVATASDRQPGLFEARGAFTPLPGDWTLDVVADGADGAAMTATFELHVEEPAPAEEVLPPATGLEAPPVLRALWVLTPLPWAGVAVVVLVAGVGAARLAEFRSHNMARRPSAVVALLRAVAVGAAVIGAVGVGSQLLVQTANGAPREAAEAANPVIADKATLDRGRRAYAANCATCHGADGTGNGPLADGWTRPRALGERVPSLTDGQLFYVITNGLAGTDMPAFARELTPSERWEIVAHLRHAFDIEQRD